MKIKVDYHLIHGLPKLAWLARFSLEDGKLSVFHGKSVECHEDWMAEGVWDGDFGSGNFHRSENFFGSGIRIEDDILYLVPSSAMVDRIFYCLNRGEILASNSLIILLGFTGASLDAEHDYCNELSILHGVKEYKKQFRVIHPEITNFFQVFYENIRIYKSEISFETRTKLHEIKSYQSYYESITKILNEIKQNYEHPFRKIRISPFTTISSGYDSTAVTSLVKNLGVRTCFTGKKANSWIPRWFGSYSDDDGTLAAKALKLDIQYLNLRHSSISEDELYFLATNYAKHSEFCLNEIAFHSMAQYIEKNSEAAVVFTAYHGDKVWGMDTTEEYLVDQILRPDTAGLGLTEARLKSGFINVPVPFMLARNIIDIHKISFSPEMEPWRLHNSYDRPIARRIAEEAGVSRGSFGIRKKAIARFSKFPINDRLRKQFFIFLKENYNISRSFIGLYNMVNLLATFVKKALVHLSLLSHGFKKTSFWSDIDFAFFMWIWSTRVLSGQMREILQTQMRESDDKLK